MGKTLEQTQELIVKTARLLGDQPTNEELQRRFAKSVGHRDESGARRTLRASRGQVF